MLSYVQEMSADIWKKNILEDLKAEVLEYATVEEFLADLKKEFCEGDNKIIKAAKLKKVEQGNKTIEKFVQKLRRIARESRYKGRPLVEEFKKGMNEAIRRKLMEAKQPPRSIE